MADYSNFELRRSSDIVKTDLELTCIDCDAVLCDAQDEDTLAILMDVANDHTCAYDPHGGQKHRFYEEN
jgi:hypothetical protein